MIEEIYCTKIKNRKNVFWYFSIEDIAKFTLGDNEILIKNVGEIRVQFPEDDVFYKNQQAVDMALSLNLYDKDLKKLDFIFCNYFDFYYKKNFSDQWEDIDGDEEFCYDIAIKKARKYLNDISFWKQF